jgi:hypothetical protein
MTGIYANNPAEFDRQGLQEALQAFLSNPESALYQQTMLEKSPVRFDDEEHEQGSEQSVRACDYGVFYQHYLSQYYPKVYVIRSMFEHMKPEVMAQSLTDVVAVFSDRTWFYFMDTNKHFNPANYWEYVIDQCALLSEFFKEARIDVETKEVFANKVERWHSTHRADGSQRKTKNLYLYLKEYHKQSIADFYALCFDYVLKLFNEGIMLKDSKQAQKYQAELEYIIAKLRNTIYEPEYQQSMKTCKELIEILKEKLSVNEMQMIDDFFGDDEVVQRIARESLRLR